MILIISICIVVLILLLCLAVKLANKVDQKRLYEKIEDQILMCESEEELNSNELFSEMQTFYMDYTYNKRGAMYCKRLNNFWNDCAEYFQLRNIADSVSNNKN